MRPAPTLLELRAATAFTSAPLRRGHVPFAAPQRLNVLASRLEDDYLDIGRDGPRRLDEQPGRPYWATLPRALSHPIADVRAKSVVARLARSAAQWGVDASVGICALAMALLYFGRLKIPTAQLILGHHALQISKAMFLTFGPGVCLALVCLL